MSSSCALHTSEHQSQKLSGNPAIESVAFAADGIQALVDGPAADKPATSARTHKSSETAVKADSAVLPVSSSKGEVADSSAPEVKPAVTADVSNTSTPADTHKADTAAADVPAANQQVATATGISDVPASIAEARSQEPTMSPAAKAVSKAEQEAAVATTLVNAEEDGGQAQEAASPEALKSNEDAGATAGAGFKEVHKETTTAAIDSKANGEASEEAGNAKGVSKPAEELPANHAVVESKQDEVIVCCWSVAVLRLLFFLTHSSQGQSRMLVCVVRPLLGVTSLMRPLTLQCCSLSLVVCPQNVLLLSLLS